VKIIGIIAAALAVLMMVPIAGVMAIAVIVGGGGAAAVAAEKNTAVSIPIMWRPALQAATTVCALTTVPLPGGVAKTDASYPTWAVLAGIGGQESDFAATGTKDPSSAGAIGPMQFKPTTWSGYIADVSAFAKGHPTLHMVTPPTDTNIFDAVIAAAYKLCTTNAPTLAERINVYATGSPTAASGSCTVHVNSIVRHGGYPTCVLTDAKTYAQQHEAWVNPVATSLATPGLQAALQAVGQLGVPYVWAGATPAGTATAKFDCSGLTMWVWAQEHVTFQHNAQAQEEQLAKTNEATTHPGPVTLSAGDLVFFGTSLSAIDHVGIYVGFTTDAAGKTVQWMIDAPHTGAVVRYDQIPPDIGGPLAGTGYKMVAVGRP